MKIKKRQSWSIIDRGQTQNIFIDYDIFQVLWAVQTPVNGDNINGSKKAITNDMISQFNAETSRVFAKSDVLIWSSLYRYI